MPSPLHSTAPFRETARIGAALLLAAGLMLPLFSAGCASISAGGFGSGFREGELEGGSVLEFDQDADAVWRRAKETLAHLSSRVPQFDEENLSAFATVDGGSIRVQVIEVAPGRSRLAVKARRYGHDSEPLAQSVLSRIAEEVER